MKWAAHRCVGEHPVADRKPDRIEAGAGQELKVRLRDPDLPVMLDGRPHDVRQRLIGCILRGSVVNASPLQEA